MTIHKKHFGVYGVAYVNEHLLCIQKKTGPYKNRFDLPGGSQKGSEGLTETLIREVWEETGYRVENYRNVRCYDVLVEEKETDRVVHHIFVLYTIDVIKQNDKLPKLGQEINDSSGPIWVAIKELTEENTSPLVTKVIAELNQELNKTFFDVKRYENWLIKGDSNKKI